MSFFTWLGIRRTGSRLVKASGRPQRKCRLGVEQLEKRCTPTSGLSASLVADIDPGADQSDPRNLTNVNGTLFFSASDGTTGSELWKSDGTAAGSVLVKDINPGNDASGYPNSSYPRDLTEMNGTLFFTANDGSHGAELWKSDGSPAGTDLVKDIFPGTNFNGIPNSSNPMHLTKVNGTLYFAANGGLWKSDGTAAGTVLVRSISPEELTNVNGTLFFRADGAKGYELWKSDGSANGTSMVKDIYSGSTRGPGYKGSGPSVPNSSFPHNLTNVNGTLFFAADDGTHGTDLWKSDGTAKGTVLVKDIRTAGDSDPSSLTNVNGTLFFTVYGINGQELWKSDGTAAGTVLLQTMGATGLTNVNGTLYFAGDSWPGRELWKSDGTPAGTVPVKDINVGFASSNPEWLTNVNGLLYFSADNGGNGRELWQSNGTDAGTVMVQDIYPGSAGSGPSFLTAMNNKLYFAADDGTHGRELWDSPPVGAPLGNTLTVMNTLDKGAGSLRDAITKAKDGDTIIFDAGINGQAITLTSGALVVKDSLDIEGPGASLLAISGNDTSRVFDISEALTVTIAGLTITRGRGAGNQGGGGILNVGSALNLANDIFSNNRAAGSNADGTSMGGGAIANRNGGVLTVNASSFIGNQAIGRQGGFGEGGAIWNLASATITDSTFTGNRAVGGDGGRVSGGATIIGVANGGAVLNQSGATLTVANSLFTANEAIGGNGGSGGAGASVYFVDAASGGGITNGDHAALVVSGCTFTYNRAIGGSNATGGASGQGRVGGASGGGLANLVGSMATVVNSVFDHNEALGGGGNSGGSGAIIFSRGAGGGISNTLAATLTISDCTLTANQAIGGPGAVSANGGDAFGGGVFNDIQCILTVTISTITANQAIGGAAGLRGSAGTGGVYLAAGAIACKDVFTSILGNAASTSDDDVFGVVTICQ